MAAFMIAISWTRVSVSNLFFFLNLALNKVTEWLCKCSTKTWIGLQLSPPIVHTLSLHFEYFKCQGSIENSVRNVLRFVLLDHVGSLIFFLPEKNTDDGLQVQFATKPIQYDNVFPGLNDFRCHPRRNWLHRHIAYYQWCMPIYNLYRLQFSKWIEQAVSNY